MGVHESSNTRPIIQGQSTLKEDGEACDETVGDVKGLNKEGGQVFHGYAQCFDQLEDLSRIAEDLKRIVGIE